MKTTLFLTPIFALFLFSACNAASDDNFLLSGRIENAGDLKTLMLYEGETVVDSIGLDNNGNFKFEGSATEPTLYELVAEQESYMLILENGEDVKFKADLNQAGKYTVKGSETSAKLKQVVDIREKYQAHQENLQEEFETRVNNGEDQEAVRKDMALKDEQFSRDLADDALQFSEDNMDNLAGFFGILVLYSVDPTGHEETLVKYAEEAKQQFPNNEIVQAFAQHMEQIKPLSIGQIAPDFSAPTPDGKEVKLSDLRGQYVLLDFWAAWCTPCRHENPNIVAQYQEFKDRGFTVLGVSLDQDRNAWLKAIEDDKLDWTQVSELKMWDSQAGRLYNITAIPASFMIDPQGKIVGKNLRGPALKDFLEEVL